MTNRDPFSALLRSMPILKPGQVWLAGAGPGDPGLLTVHTLSGLAQASVVVHDALVDDRVLALVRPPTRLEFAGKRGGKPSAAQADISDRLIVLARSGERVLRLKGGDPFVFGRGGEEALALAGAGIPYWVIPGVTSGLAALAAASIPATMRGINRAVILAAGYGTGEADVNWAALARTGEPIILYMPMHHLESIADALIRGGASPETPVAVISSATTGDERILMSTLEHVAADTQASELEPPAIVAIGDIVNMRSRLRADHKERS
jgi:uroporphyrin-III C-methyltransferase